MAEVANEFSVLMIKEELDLAIENSNNMLLLLWKCSPNDSGVPDLGAPGGPWTP